MNEFDEIYSLKKGEEKSERLINYYNEKVIISKWLTNDYNVSIIHFRDRIEYKKFNKFHRINGPAVDYGDDALDKYYYKGKFFESKDEWKKVTLKDLRKIKIKKIKKSAK